MINLKNLITSFLRKQALTRLILGSMMSIGIMLILVVGHYWASYENKKYRTEYNQIKKELVEYQKQLVSREVTRTLNYITYMRSLSQERMMDDLKSRVNTAWDIADNIYKVNAGKKSDAEIQKMITDALRAYKSGDQNDNVFIYTLQGISVLNPRNPKMEGTSGLNLKDSLSNYLVKREIDLMKEVDKGYISYYVKSKGDYKDSLLYRYSYIKKFKPFGWYIGSKEYLTDFEEKLKEDIVNRVSKIRFDNEGYLFIQYFDNMPLMTNGHIIRKEDKNRLPVDLINRKKISEVALKGGGFVEYQINNRKTSSGKELKIAYVAPIKEWSWIVGAGFYSNDIDQLIRLKSEELSKQKRKTITIIAISLLVIMFLGYILTKLLVNKIEKGFLKFDRFFADAISKHTPINEDELFLPEFISLGKSANKMLSELQTTRSALEKEHSLLRSVMNSIPDLVFFKDIQSRYVNCNDAFCKFLGIREEELFGKTDYELFPTEAADFYYNNDLKILKDGIPIRNEEWVTLPNGTKCLYDTVKALCHDKAGNVIGIICISRDITEKEEIQKKYIEAKEKAEESDRLKTAFLANMSHEIRTPMNSIVGFSNLIAEGGLTKEEEKEYVGHIDTAINNLLNIISDIIDIAKIEAGQLSIKPEYINLSRLIDDQYISSQEYRKRLGKTNLEITCSIDPRLKNPMILADPFRLNQVFTNLVNNAIKFTQRGSVHFGCELQENTIYCYVKDTGIGISESDQQLLFRRFRQVGELNGHKMGGTGLGLAISKHIIELMHGQINVSSMKGSGSLFSFTIPYYPQQEETDKRLKITATSWKDKTIMIIDGQDASYNYLKAVFAKTGASIIRSETTSEAIKLVKQTDRIDLIYTELDRTDPALIQFIQVVKKNSYYIPIVAQVSYDNQSIASELGCDSLIIKPVQYHLLLSSIAHYLTEVENQV